MGLKLKNYRTSVGPTLDLNIGASGSRQGRPVLLLHVLSDSWRSFLPLMAEIPKNLRLIAVSKQGHGNSAKPSRAYCLAEAADDVITVMDALGLAQADIVGHSLGSTVAQKVVERTPDRVASLILIGAFIRLDTDPAVSGLWEETVALMTDPVDASFVRALQESAVGPDTSRQIIEQAVAESLKLRADVWRAALAAGTTTDLTKALARFDRPVLVVHGQLDDFSLAEEQAELAQENRRRLASHPEWGHSPHWERPAAVATLMAQFIADVSAPVNA